MARTNWCSRSRWSNSIRRTFPPSPVGRCCSRRPMPPSTSWRSTPPTPRPAYSSSTVTWTRRSARAPIIGALAERRVHVTVLELYAGRGVGGVDLHEVLGGIGRREQHLPTGLGGKVRRIELLHLEREHQFVRAIHEERLGYHDRVDVVLRVLRRSELIPDRIPPQCDAG